MAKNDMMIDETETPAENASPNSVNNKATLLDILQVIADNLRLLVLGPLVVGMLALGTSFMMTPIYTATNTFLPPQQQQSAAATMLQSLGALGGLAAGASGLKNPTDQYVAFLKTRTVQDVLVDRFDLMERYHQKYRQDTRVILGNNSRILSGKENLIVVEFDDKDPQFAANVANAYVEELGRLLNRLAVTEAQQRRVFFDKQLAETKQNLIKAEQALAGTGVSVATLNANPSTAMEGPARLRAQLTAQEVKLASMRSFLTESAPEYRQAAAELAALRNQLMKAEQQQPAARIGSDDYIAKYREFKYQETLFELFAKQFEVAKIDESREGAIIQVVDPAQPLDHKAKPKKALIAAVAAVVTGFLLLIVLFFRYAVANEKRDLVSAQKFIRLRNSFARAIWRA